MPIRVYELKLAQTEVTTLAVLRAVIWTLKSLRMNTHFQLEKTKIDFDINTQMLIDFIEKHVKLIEDAL